MTGRWHKLQINGPPLAVLDAESRSEIYDHKASRKPQNKPSAPAKLDLRALIDEAAQGDRNTTPTQPTPSTTKPRSPPPYNPTGTGEDAEYDATNPLAGLSSILQRLRQTTYRSTAPQDVEQELKYNPHLMHHMLTGAPYTASLCRRCTPDRACRVHQETYREMTSVSLCPHLRMNLWWSINDPHNLLGSWSFVIRDYTHGDAYMGEEHKGCKGGVYKPSERVALLAERMVEDFRRERVRVERDGGAGVRGCERRVREEIAALVGAWEVAKLERLEAGARRREVEERREEGARRAGEELAETLRLLQGGREKEVAEVKKSNGKKRKMSEVEEGEISQVRKWMRVEETTSEEIFPAVVRTPPSTSAQTPEATTPANAEVEEVMSQSPVSLPTPVDTPPKRTKRVHFTLEIEASADIERPRMHSPRVHVARGDGDLSPVARWYGYEVEDEVDYEDDDLEE